MSSSNRTAAYKDAGVDIEAGNLLISRIKKMVGTTFTRGVITDLGGFGGLFKIDMEGLKQPVLVGATDGVGTKLKLAFLFDVHHTVGIDLVAMSVNDILVQGAKPLFFLDYFATGKLEVEKAEKVIAGVVEGCKQAGCALLGGETAEMPDFYGSGEYDLSGFCVGMVDFDKIVDGSQIRKGDILIGLASSGLHSNGFSLVRKLFSSSKLQRDDKFPGTDKNVWEVLLEPTKIYVKPVLNVLRDLEIRGMVHITGGGFYDNIPRILPTGVKVVIDFNSFVKPAVFHWIKEEGNLSWEEMANIFNCGIGFILIIKPDLKEDVLLRLKAQQIDAWEIGRVEICSSNEEVVQIKF
ncbi:phosphoribosylformylglycinamidine cyclo-ligase [Desulfonauticus submarinus]|uniref:Phosphoribosylformylglycinamidine cyclo-ligase n=1 Tax=Desulfonauticus submarinus TaxID=206665 RepID=A0A1H0B7C9_9BACT|nr:phosphoribosylformylglycinamidine cyclo-ligase [Desulfonauticus submarinus]SDN41534.1 phosphoribosylformylglycinamidine cyclo-ligase [Desulfonauticus submarinus]